MFQVIEPADDGAMLIPSDNPRLDAYRYAAMLKTIQHRTYQLRIDDGDGSYTVTSDGLAPMRFTPAA